MNTDHSTADGEDYAPETPALWDENGQLVPITLPAVYDAPYDDSDPSYTETLAGAALDFVNTAPSVALVGERSILLSYILKSFAAPKNLRDLGQRLGCSHTTARKRVSKFRNHLREELEDFAP